MKKIILSTLSILITGLILTNISCEKLEVKRVIKIKTVEAYNVTATDADVSGNFIDLGSSGIYEWGFCYDTAGNPDISSDKVSPTGAPKKGDFNAHLGDLQPNTTYFVKAFAKGETEVKYGGVISFTTPDQGVITISSPLSTDRWPVGSTRQITWTDNIDEQVRIELWRTNETQPFELIADGIESFGSFDWDIPANLPVEAGWRIKIQSFDDTSIYGFSEEFEITAAQSITVIGPSGGQYVHMGNAYDITWQSDFGGSVKISLFMNDGIHSDIITSTENDGIYEWIIPSGGSIIAGADYSINISSVDDANVYDTGTWFEIAEAPFIAIDDPNASSIWLMGSTREITWSDNIIENVRIELYKGGSLEIEIANNTESDGSHNWAIPNGLTDASDYTIRMTGVVNGTTGESAQFTLSSPNIAVTSPTSGIDWQMGSMYDITWTSNIQDNIKIELFKGGTLVAVNGTISSVTSNTGSHSWTLPTTYVPGSDYTIKVSSAIDGNINAFSDQFSISEPTGSVGAVTDIDVNTYPTIKIGAQWWMAENLKVTRYADGTAIPDDPGNDANVYTLTEWAALGDNNTDKAYCYYMNNASNEADTYGALYTYAAATNGTPHDGTNDVQGVCPTGWHLPSDDEWKELEMDLGMSQADADGEGLRGTNEGSKLGGNAGLWYNGGLDSNAEFGISGFSALPGGYRIHNGNFNDLYSNGYWWSAAEDGATLSWVRALVYSTSNVSRYNSNKSSGKSVRCVKD